LFQALKGPLQQGMIRPNIPNNLDINQKGLQFCRDVAEIFSRSMLASSLWWNSPSIKGEILKVTKTRLLKHLEGRQLMIQHVPITSHKTGSRRKETNRANN
jgi:hypothetical protein